MTGSIENSQHGIIGHEASVLSDQHRLDPFLMNERSIVEAAYRAASSILWITLDSVHSSLHPVAAGYYFVYGLHKRYGYAGSCRLQASMELVRTATNCHLPLSTNLYDRAEKLKGCRLELAMGERKGMIRSYFGQCGLNRVWRKSGHGGTIVH